MSAFWGACSDEKGEQRPRTDSATSRCHPNRTALPLQRYVQATENRNTALERLERPISITEDRDRSRESSGQLAVVTIRVAMFVAHRSGALAITRGKIGLAPHDGSRTSSGPMSQARFLKSSCHAPSAPAHEPPAVVEGRRNHQACTPRPRSTETTIVWRSRCANRISIAHPHRRRV